MSTLKLKNGTTKSETGKDSLKFCIYNAKDAAQIFPVEGGVGTISNGNTLDWTKSAGDKCKSYRIKWFKAALFDELLASGTASPGGSCEIYYDGGYHTRPIS